MKDKRGITLIALIITVIILLILSALIIDFVVDGKIIDKSRETQASLQNQANEHNSIVDLVRDIYNPSTTGDNNTSGDDTTPNNAPIISSVTLNTKTTNSFTVDVTASDSDGEELTYSLYVNGSSEPAETKTVAQSSEAVQLTASSLNMYTDYTYYVTVTDNTDNAKSEAATVKTKCSGTTITCTTSSCTGKTEVACTTCKGNGNVSEQCSGGYYQTCSLCDNTGYFPCGGTFYWNNYDTITGSTCSDCGTKENAIIIQCSSGYCSYYYTTCACR